MDTYNEVLSIVSRNMEVVDLTCRASDYFPESHNELLDRVDLVVSVFNGVRITGKALTIPNFNIHMAPLWYRGMGGVGRAVVDKRDRHGLVVHQMCDEYDSGRILYEEQYDISGLSPSQIGLECKKRAMVQLERFCVYFARHGELPEPERQINWEGDVMRLREFKSWLISIEFDGKEDVLEFYKPYF
jgi:hypothetical protein